MFARFQVFFDELVGQDKLCFRDRAERKPVALSARLYDDIVAFEPEKHSAEAPPAGRIRRVKLDLGLMARPARKIANACERPVDAG